jgi:hypothetical protein
MSFAETIDTYVNAVQILRRAVEGMSRDQALARPVPGKWSTLEVVCHLADFESVYADRMKRVIAEDRPLFISADEKRYAAALAYQDRDLEEELTLIDRTRRQMARILRKQPAGTERREGVYRNEGKDEVRSLERLLTIISGHIAHHVKFIDEKRKALGK